MTAGDRCPVCGLMDCTRDHAADGDEVARVPEHLRPGGRSTPAARRPATTRRPPAPPAEDPMPEPKPDPKPAAAEDDRPRCGKTYRRHGKDRTCTRWKWPESPTGLCYSHEMQIRRAAERRDRQDTPQGGTRALAAPAATAQPVPGLAEMIRSLRDRRRALAEELSRTDAAIAALRGLNGDE